MIINTTRKLINKNKNISVRKYHTTLILSTGNIFNLSIYTKRVLLDLIKCHSSLINTNMSTSQ
jgi:hypothetical protein